MISKIIISFLMILSLNADDIISFVADDTDVSPDDVVNLTLSTIVTKKYKLNLTAYNQSTNTKLTASFVASDINNIQYTVPSDADYDIKLLAELIEDNNVIASKEIILNSSNADGLYFCSTYGTFGLEIYTGNSSLSNCFKPIPDTEYNIVYGDDRAAMLFVAGNTFKYSGNSFNAVALNTNTKIHYYNKTINSLGSYSGYGCIRNCDSTFLGASSAKDGYNYADTESRITAMYESSTNSIKIVSRGGYYPCSCGSNNCCGEGLVYTRYIELN